MVTGFPLLLRSLPVCNAIAACALGLVSVAYLQTELTYDEAVYLQLARVITEHGLPLPREYDDFTQFRLFENSPPLVLYVTAVSQLVFPRNETAARLVHLTVFVVPTYVIVWCVVRVRFGQWAAFASLVAFFTSGGYMRATSHVLLNIPLGLLACVTLVAFHSASCSPARRTWYVTVASIGIALAVWTKYQSVCVVVAIVIFAVYTVWSKGLSGFRPMLLPLTTTAITAGAAIAVLVWFFWTFGGSGTLQATLDWNLRRINVAPLALSQILEGLTDTLRESVGMLGGAALLAAAFGVCTERRHGLLVLLAGYVAVSVVFCLMMFRLPGSGGAYLHAAVPTLAMVAGPGAVRIVQLAATTSSRMILAGAMIVIQLGGSGNANWRYEVPRPNGSRAAAAYIAAHSSPTSGVLASTVAVEFYTGRPVRVIGFTYPRNLVWRSLDGTSGDDIAFVVTGDGPATLQNLEPSREQWDRLLNEHFEPAFVTAFDVRVYRRRAP